MKSKTKKRLFYAVIIIATIVNLAPYAVDAGTSLYTKYYVLKNLASTTNSSTNDIEDYDSTDSDEDQSVDEYINNAQELQNYLDSYNDSDTQEEDFYVTRDMVQEYLNNNEYAMQSLVKDNKLGSSVDSSEYYDNYYTDLFDNATSESDRGRAIIDYYTHQYIEDIKSSYAAYIEYYYPGSVWEYEFETVPDGYEGCDVYATGTYFYINEDNTTIKFIASGYLGSSSDNMEYSLSVYEVDTYGNMNPVAIEDYIF